MSSLLCQPRLAYGTPSRKAAHPVTRRQCWHAAGHTAARRRSRARALPDDVLEDESDLDVYENSTEDAGPVDAAAASAMLSDVERHAVDISYAAGQCLLSLETGEIGRLSGGAVFARSGETAIYATACADRESRGYDGFAPLQVNYQERLSAAGRTPSGYLKRDRVGTHEILTARLVDRPLRPLFPPGWGYETQVLEWVMSFDPDHNPQPLAITAAAAALLLSDVHFTTAVAGVQVGLIDGELVVNPTAEQMEASDLDLLMAGTERAVLMIEGFANFLPEERVLEAIALGHEAISDICSQLQAWAGKVGKAKRPLQPTAPEWLSQRIGQVDGGEMQGAYQISKKQERGERVGAVRARITEELAAEVEEAEVTSGQLKSACKAYESNIMRSLLLERGIRPDGRAIDEVRPIAARAGLLPRAHGSVLFTRGETQTIATATLGSSNMTQYGETLAALHEESGQKFYLQYVFPPSSVGETGRVGFTPGRREIGHGKLAERALLPALPQGDPAFPYVVRVESHITESNGSSSMASVCGGCLAMLDAGVPLKREVAGVAMGLVLASDGSFVILTDILGLEDALGDMDFKVAGDADGITAFQMDIKVEGITIGTMREALGAARVARRHILAEMAQCSPAPRRELGPYVTRVMSMQIPNDKVGGIIGTGGKVIKGLREQYGVELDIRDRGPEGQFMEVSCDVAKVPAAKAVLKHVAALVTDLEVGQIHRCKVARIIDSGAIVEMIPSGKDALVHVSELALEPVESVAAAVSVGEELTVKIMEVSDRSTRASVAAIEREKLGIPEPKRNSRSGGGRGGRRGGRGGGGRDNGRSRRGNGSSDSEGSRSESEGESKRQTKPLIRPTPPPSL